MPLLEAPKFLSPSSISTFKQCPLKFKYGRIDKLPDPPGVDAVLGSFVHATMEDLFALPAGERDQTAAKRLMMQQWRDEWRDKASEITADLHGFQWRAWWCIENYFEMEDPNLLSLSGIETYVEGEIAGAKVRGYIDRWHLSTGGAVIGDYKTGKTPAPKFTDDKFFQLNVYAKLMNDQGTSVESVELLYLKDGVRLRRQVRRSDLTAVEETVAGVRAEILSCCETGHFDAKPSRLCDWCSFKPICPAHTRG